MILKNDFKQQTLCFLRAWLNNAPEALAVLDPSVLQSVINTLCGDFDNNPDDFLTTRLRKNQQWLDNQGLTPLIASLVFSLDPDIRNSVDILRKKRQGYAGRSLHLEGSARIMTKALDAWGRPWAIMKGFALARRVYDQPWMRLSSDIDVLVRPEDWHDALAVLYSIGGEDGPQVIQPNEQTVYIKGIGIDLHNAPMRKGRLRFNPAADWLSRINRVEIFPGLSEHDELVLSFFHPAVTEYLAARMVRMLDIVLQVKRNREAIDWQRVADDVLGFGLANAAYATALRVNQLFASKHEPVIPEQFIETLNISGFRRRYWRFWLDRQPDRLYANSPFLAQLLFSLWLNDSPRDWLRALADKYASTRGNPATGSGFRRAGPS